MTSYLLALTLNELVFKKKSHRSKTLLKSKIEINIKKIFLIKK